MKRLASLALCFLLFCACAPEKKTETSLSFSALPGDLFPFYCADEQNRVWRVECDRAVCLDITVSEDADETFFYYNPAKDTALFACDESRENGVSLCSLVSVQGRGQARVAARNVQSASLRAFANGTALFTDAQNTLFYFDGQNVLETARDVAQAEFLSGETILYRLNRAQAVDGEFLYPVYAAEPGSSARFLTDAAAILRVDPARGRAYLIRGRRLIQKRTAQAETALVSVCDRSDVLFELPSVLLSQFGSAPVGTHLLSCDETAPTLQYTLFRADGSEPVMEAENVLAGRVVSSDGRAYVYEQMREGTIERKLLTDGETRTIPAIAASSPDDYFVCGAHCYRLENGTLYEGDKPIAQSVSSCLLAGEDLLCVHAMAPPCGISLCRGSTVSLLTGDAADSRFRWDGQTLWYISATDDGLTASNASGEHTAVLSRIDPETAFLCAGRSAAAIKDGCLYLACEDQLVRLDLPARYLFQ